MARKAGKWHVERIGREQYMGKVRVGGHVYYTALCPTYAAAATECRRLLGTLPLGNERRSGPLNPAKVSLLK